MSKDEDKFKHSKRLHKDDVAIAKQLKIAKAHNNFPDNHALLKESHRLAKHHAMDCGTPGCAMCGNPRHIHKDGLTAQEKRLFQDLDTITIKSNGLLPKLDDE